MTNNIIEKRDVPRQIRLGGVVLFAWGATVFFGELFLHGKLIQQYLK